MLKFLDEMIKRDSLTKRVQKRKEEIKKELSQRVIKVADLETLEAILQDPQILQDFLPSRIGPIK